MSRSTDPTLFVPLRSEMDTLLDSIPVIEQFTFTGNTVLTSFSHTFTVVDPTKAPNITARLRTVGTTISPVLVSDAGAVTFLTAPATGTWDVTAVGSAL